jgi:hypothetical protein
MADGKLDKLPDYEKNDLRPSQRNPLDRIGEERDGLRYAQGNMMVQEFRGDAPNYPSTAPASAQFTPGLPTPAKDRDGDEGTITIQFGIPRVR